MQPNEVVVNLKIIGITGDSGVGKSTITLRLSEKLSCPFLDIDKVILNSEYLETESKTTHTFKLKSEHFNLLIDNLKNTESPISNLINNLVKQEISKISKENKTIIVEWMLLPYLKIWQDCNTKILINANDILRKNTAIKNNLITEKQFDDCVAVARIDYSEFNYDYIFENNYDEKSLENILDKFKNNCEI
jgi:dephospho-CoA kinase